MPKTITHENAMKDIDQPFRDFLEDISPLQEKRGPLLCQLPPSLAFDAAKFRTAFQTMRALDTGSIVIEPRHKSWTDPEALELLNTYAIDPVLADPAPVWPADVFVPGAKYIRLHGKPKIYYSTYTPEEIRSFGASLMTDGWCIFDNTASGAAIENALTMRNII